MDEMSSKSFHKHIIIIGPATAGKTTQGAALAGLLRNYRFIDMSMVLATAAAFQPALEDTIKRYKHEGKLVPDEINMPQLDMFLQTVEKNAGVIFSGVPRKAEQVDPFMEAVKLRIGCTKMVVADLDLPISEAINRRRDRVERYRAKGIPPRKDDLDEKAVRTRLQEYQANREKLIKRIEDFAPVVTIPCHNNPQDTLLDMIRLLKIDDEAFFIKPAGL
jgi:adenylate kinase family enzyme